jgi:hypothetical protein
VLKIPPFAKPQTVISNRADRHTATQTTMTREFTDIEKAYINFFGNSAEFGGQVDELRSYLNEVRNFIEVTNHHLQNDKIKGYDNDTLADLKYHYEYTHGDISRKSILISTIILLESGIDIYCKDFQKQQKLKIGYKDLKGDLLDRFKFYSLKILNSSFDFNSRLWQDISGLYEIRNCLVHNNGSLENFGKRKVIEEFVKRNRSFEITEDEFIEITHQACLFGLDSIDKFHVEITMFAFEIYPDFH